MIKRNVGLLSKTRKPHRLYFKKNKTKQRINQQLWCKFSNFMKKHRHINIKHLQKHQKNLKDWNFSCLPGPRIGSSSKLLQSPNTSKLLKTPSNQNCEPKDQASDRVVHRKTPNEKNPERKKSKSETSHYHQTSIFNRKPGHTPSIASKESDSRTRTQSRRQQNQNTKVGNRSKASSFSGLCREMKKIESKEEGGGGVGEALAMGRA